MQGQSVVSIRNFWTAEQDEYVRENYRTKSAAEIGAFLGKTKNAVIGRAGRLKLSISLREHHSRMRINADQEYSRKKQRAVKKLAEKKPAKTRKERGHDRSRAGFFRVLRKSDPVDLTSLDKIDPINGVGVKIWELESKHCRWVVGEPKDLTFCGHNKQEGSSYCKDHHPHTMRNK